MPSKKTPRSAPAPDSPPSSIPPLQASAMATALAEWFAREGKSYPWRETTDPYALLVSEMMLQQTTIAMVLERQHYQKWMQAFPTVEALAAAAEADILRLWEGLGYYNRARNLQKTAQAIIRDHGGQFPQTVADLLTLPGIGRYTAGAVASFAYDTPVPVVDGNVSRILSRLMDDARPIDEPEMISQLWTWAEQLVPPHGARIHNAALMQLGQRVCTPSRPTCLLCPLKRWCRTDRPDQLPQKKPKRAPVRLNEAVLLAKRPDGSVLLRQESGSRRKGLWLLPPVAERPVQAACWTGKYAITHYRVSLSIHRPLRAASVTLLPGEVWVSLDSVTRLAMPSPIRRALLAALDC